MNLVVGTSLPVAVLVSEPEREKRVALTADPGPRAPGSVHRGMGNALAPASVRHLLQSDGDGQGMVQRPLLLRIQASDEIAQQ